MNTRILAILTLVVSLQIVAIAGLGDTAPAPFATGTLVVAAGNFAAAYDPTLASLPVLATGLLNARDVAFAPDASLLLADAEADAVYVRDAAGAALGTLSAAGELDDPAGIAVGPGGEIYVASRGADQVVVFTAEGDFLRSFGADAGLIEPWGLAFDSLGRLHVTCGDGPVRAFDPSGALLDTFTDAALSDPRGLCFGSDGRLYVASAGSDAIVVLDSAGALLDSFDNNGTLQDPAGIAMGPDNLLYVTSEATGAITLFDAEGVFVGAISGSTPDGAAGLAFAPKLFKASVKGSWQVPGGKKNKLKLSGLLTLRPGALPCTLRLDDPLADAADLVGAVSVWHGLHFDSPDLARVVTGLQLGPGTPAVSTLQLNLKLAETDGPAGSAPLLQAKKGKGQLEVSAPGGLVNGDMKLSKVQP